MRNTEIILVDDDDVYSDLIKKQIKRYGIDKEFIRFSDGQEFVDFISDTLKKSENDESSFNFVVLLDLAMPQLDGLAVLKALHASKVINNKKLKIIISSSNYDPALAQRCFSLGCEEFVPKDPDVSSLVGSVKKLISNFN